MFNSNHYIPILKWKRAEQGALQALTLGDKKNMTPLIQMVMPRHSPDENFESVAEKFRKKLNQIPENIIETWGKTLFLLISAYFLLLN